MRRLLVLAALVATFVFLAPLTGHAQMVTMMTSVPCFPETDLPKLQKQYGESRIGAGIGTDGTTVVEVLVSAETGTFTVISRTTQGMICLIGAGKNWQAFAPEAKGEGL